MSSALGSVRPNSLSRRVPLDEGGSLDGGRCSRSRFTPGGFLVQLPSYRATHRFPSCRLFLCGLDPRCLLPRAAGLLPFGLLPCSSCRLLPRGLLRPPPAARLDPLSFLAGSLLPRSLLSCRCLPRGLLAFSFLPRVLDPLSFLAGSLLPRSLLPCRCLPRGLLAFGFLPRGLDPLGFLARGLLPRSLLPCRLQPRVLDALRFLA